jgi:hypothetical protein
MTEIRMAKYPTINFNFLNYAFITHIIKNVTLSFMFGKNSLTPDSAEYVMVQWLALILYRTAQVQSLA